MSFPPKSKLLRKIAKKCSCVWEFVRIMEQFPAQEGNLCANLYFLFEPNCRMDLKRGPIVRFLAKIICKYFE